MNDKELYKQKFQAQLDELKAYISILKARTSKTEANVQIAINKHLKLLKLKFDKAQMKLSVLTRANEEAWDSSKKGIESIRNFLEAAIKGTASKFKH